MYPQTHFIVPFLLAEVLVKLGILNHKLAFLAGLIGVIIDLDHYLYRVIKYKDFSLKDSWNGAIVRGDPGERTFLHHRFGALIVALISGVMGLFYWPGAIVLVLGYYSHLLLDDIHIKTKKILRLKEEGYVFKIPFYEIIVDVILGLLILTIIF
ncbi:MAG: metal-dependent hydrolase [Candidatus Woesearchaeota archaeon]